MRGNPFVLEYEGDPRDWEDRLFTFLADQALHFDSSAWRALLAEPAKAEDVAYTALLFSNLTEQLTPDASRAAYTLATELLEQPPTVESYGDWLRHGLFDVNRLAGFLDFKLVHEPSFGG